MCRGSRIGVSKDEGSCFRCRLAPAHAAFNHFIGRWFCTYPPHTSPSLTHTLASASYFLSGICPSSLAIGQLNIQALSAQVIRCGGARDSIGTRLSKHASRVRNASESAPHLDNRDWKPRRALITLPYLF